MPFQFEQQTKKLSWHACASMQNIELIFMHACVVFVDALSTALGMHGFIFLVPSAGACTRRARQVYGVPYTCRHTYRLRHSPPRGITESKQQSVIDVTELRDERDVYAVRDTRKTKTKAKMLQALQKSCQDYYLTCVKHLFA